MDSVSGLFLDVLGTDMTVMEGYFPFIKEAFGIFQYISWSILLLILVWQLFRSYTGPISEAENPLHLLARTAIFAFAIGFSKNIFDIVLNIARAPYTALLDHTLDPGSFTFAGIENIIKNNLVNLGSALTVIAPILQLILMVSIGWNYFKLLLEVVERYIVVGVLCYTSPLAYSLGGSKSTNQVFKSWCRMIGSQLLLLIMNIWFLRAFNSAVGQFLGNAGALPGGGGSFFLWLFCVLAFLKTAQKFDSYLSSLGLSVAQTGGSMGMEMLMVARSMAGFAGGHKSAGSAFKSATTGAASTLGSASGGFMAGFASKFNPNSYVRDAVVEGGVPMGAGGALGMIGRTFGGMAAKNGASLSPESVASVATGMPRNAGMIAGNIADRSVAGYMPHLAGIPHTNTEISGGHISTSVATPDGSQAALDLYSASRYEKPEAPFTNVAASDGSQWYQMASGDGMGSFYHTPGFTGELSETSAVSAAFPGMDMENTSLRTVDDGILEATHVGQGSSLWYSGGHFEQPDGPHDVVTASDGGSWYAMQPHAAPPDFQAGASANASSNAFNIAAFQGYMPGFHADIQGIDTNAGKDGILDIKQKNGDGTRLYDSTVFAAPRGDYSVFEAKDGSHWYAQQGKATVERRPEYSDGKPVYENGKLKVVNVETVRYPGAPTKLEIPKRRDPSVKKAPKLKP